jgi:hypothetical protein
MGIVDWFARPKKADDENVNTPQPSTAGGSTFGYQFGRAPVKMPGAAYYSPLQRFQGYPENVWQGRGVAVERFFRPITPAGVTNMQQQIVSGGSGTVTGQIYSAPLIDTGGGKAVV